MIDRFDKAFGTTIVYCDECDLEKTEKLLIDILCREYYEKYKENRWLHGDDTAGSH